MATAKLRKMKYGLRFRLCGDHTCTTRGHSTITTVFWILCDFQLAFGTHSYILIF